MEWIKISDRLPQNNEEVIVFENGNVFAGVQYFENGGFLAYEGGADYNRSTHWMPLPSPPTE